MMGDEKGGDFTFARAFLRVYSASFCNHHKPNQNTSRLFSENADFVPHFPKTKTLPLFLYEFTPFSGKVNENHVLAPNNCDQIIIFISSGSSSSADHNGGGLVFYRLLLHGRLGFEGGWESEGDKEFPGIVYLSVYSGN